MSYIEEGNCHSFLCLLAFDTANVQSLVTKGKLAQDKADKALSLLKGVLDYTKFKDVGMVIEVSNSEFNCIVEFGILIIPRIDVKFYVHFYCFLIACVLIMMKDLVDICHKLKKKMKDLANG